MACFFGPSVDDLFGRWLADAYQGSGSVRRERWDAPLALLLLWSPVMYSGIMREKLPSSVLLPIWPAPSTATSQLYPGSEPWIT